jgi:hypothetical protein
LAQLRDKFLQEFDGINELSIWTVDRASREFHYSFKRLRLVPVARNTPDVINKRFEYAVKYNQLMTEKDKLFFIDEMGVQVWSRGGCGRSAKGENAYKSVGALRSRNFSVCAAMNHNSLFFFEIQDRPYNAEHYSGFLSQLFDHLSREGITGAHLVMDNVRFHHSEQVTYLIEAHQHNAVFLPPYSPFLDPNEELFSQWKRLIRRSESTMWTNSTPLFSTHRMLFQNLIVVIMSDIWRPISFRV